MARILIIEDDPDLSDLMAVTLRPAGHDVLTAGDGAEGLCALGTFAPDLLVIDIMLPDIVGLSLCERVRSTSLPGERRIPILITSACDERDAGPLATAAGADAFLPKPFSPYQLLLRLHALLGRPAEKTLAG